MSLDSFLAVFTDSANRGGYHGILYAVAIFCFVYGAMLILRRHVITYLTKCAEKTSTKADDVIMDVLHNIGAPFFFGVSLYASIQHLALPHLIDFLLEGFFLFVLVAEVIKIVERVLMSVLSRDTEDEDHGSGASAAIKLMMRIVLWIIGLLLILSNLGFNVNSLIASLGIGGLAVSLALQNVFNDIFSSFSIVIDKPFEEGDYIKLDEENAGNVERIGLKTTRLKTLQGEELVISNTELTSSKVRNFKKLKTRRVVFPIGVVYGTSVTKLKKVQTIVRKVFKEEKEVTDLDRVHLKEMGDFSLNFEVVYHVLSEDYTEYMDVQERINFGLIKELEAEGIELAFPTQTVFLEKTE